MGGSFQALVDVSVDIQRGLITSLIGPSGLKAIKAVLPALTGGGYQGDAIEGGRQAANEYVRVVYGDVSDAERDAVLKAVHVTPGAQRDRRPVRGADDRRHGRRPAARGGPRRHPKARLRGLDG